MALLSKLLDNFRIWTNGKRQNLHYARTNQYNQRREPPAARNYSPVPRVSYVQQSAPARIDEISDGSTCLANMLNLLLHLLVFELIAAEEQMDCSVKYLCKASYIEM